MTSSLHDPAGARTALEKSGIQDSPFRSLREERWWPGVMAYHSCPKESRGREPHSREARVSQGWRETQEQTAGGLPLPSSSFPSPVISFPYSYWRDRKLSMTHSCPRRRLTPVLLPGQSHGWRSLVGCSPWGREKSDTTEGLHFHFSLSCIGEGNGNPLRCSCLENPRDGRAWWAASMGSHRVGHDWSDLAAAAAV